MRVPLSPAGELAKVEIGDHEGGQRTLDDDTLREQSTATATAILAAESGLSPGFLRLRAGVVDVAWSLVDAVTGTATGR